MANVPYDIGHCGLKTYGAEGGGKIPRKIKISEIYERKNSRNSEILGFSFFFGETRSLHFASLNQCHHTTDATTKPRVI